MDIYFMDTINEINRCQMTKTYYYLERNVCQQFLYNSFHSFRKYYMKSTIQKISEYLITQHIEKISTFKYQHYVQPSFKRCRNESQ